MDEYHEITYYQWAAIILALSAVMFYLPCKVWYYFAERAGMYGCCMTRVRSNVFRTLGRILLEIFQMSGSFSTTNSRFRKICFYKRYEICPVEFYGDSKNFQLQKLKNVNQTNPLLIFCCCHSISKASNVRKQQSAFLLL